MKIKELCPDERPREKLLQKGPHSLSDSELLAILLRNGTNGKNVIDVARELLNTAGGKLNNIAAMSLETKCRVIGIGPDKAAALSAAFELARRCAEEELNCKRTKISSPKTVYSLMLPHMRNLEHEECWILFLNKANFLIGKECLSHGGMESTVIDMRIILRKALEKKACGIILVHNHPSGSSIPGTADINQTRLLQTALKTCDINLIDHVVVANDNYYSFADCEQVNCRDKKICHREI